MHVFDASSIVHAWDNYPAAQFPGLWNWLAAELHADNISLPTVAYTEVEHVAPDCARWLTENGLTPLELTEPMLQDALTFKNLIGVIGERYGHGVDENDLLIIACALHHGAPLVSNEARQLALPKLKYNCKIPAVCGMEDVGVQCIGFLDFMKESGAVF